MVLPSVSPKFFTTPPPGRSFGRCWACTESLRQGIAEAPSFPLGAALPCGGSVCSLCPRQRAL